MSKVTKSSNDKIIGGVCSGLADFFRLPPLLIRSIFLITSPGSVWIYLILNWVLDEEPTMLK